MRAAVSADYEKLKDRMANLESTASKARESSAMSPARTFVSSSAPASKQQMQMKSLQAASSTWKVDNP